MKKHYLLLCLFSLLFTIGCSNELDTRSSFGEEVSVTFTTDVTNVVQTRAFSEGESAKYLSYAVFVEGQSTSVLSSTNIESVGGEWEFSIKLVKGMSYDIVFWAQSDEAPYAFDASTGIVTATYDDKVLANRDIFDAFYHLEESYKVEGPASKPVTLRRAVAQINVGTNDIEDAKKIGVTDITSSSMTIKDVYPQFDILNKTVTGTPADVTFNHHELTEIDGKFSVDGDEYDYLLRNYIFANGNVTLSFEVLYNGDKTMSYSNITNVPVKENYRTNIYGSLFLNPVSMKVVIDNSFDGDENKILTHEVSEWSEIEEVLKTSSGDVVGVKYTGPAPTATTTITIPEECEGKTVALELPAISGAEDDKYIIKSEKANVIEVSVPTESQNNIVVNAPLSTVTVNGTIINLESTTSENTLIIGAGSVVTNLKVLAGNVKLEGDAEVKSILNETEGVIYLTVSKGESKFPTPSNNIVVVYSDDERVLREALANGEEFTLTKDMYVSLEKPFYIAKDKEFSLNLNGKKISAINTVTGKNSSIFEVQGTLNVSNGTVEYIHEGDNMGWNYCTFNFYVHGGGILNTEKVVVTNLGGTDMNFCVHLNNWGDVTLNAENSVFDADYCGVRVFNSGPQMNNVVIKNSKLIGLTRAFWVHNYTAEKKDDSTLNFDIFNNDNKFELRGTAISPIRYGASDPIFFNERGQQVIQMENGAVAVVISYNSNKTSLENGTMLWNSIMEGENGATYYLTDGKYSLDDGTSRFVDKSFTLIGNGEATIIEGAKYGMVFQCDKLDGNRDVVTLKNIKVTSSHSWGHPIYAKNNITVNLDNVICSNPGNVAILLDSANAINEEFVVGINTIVNAKGVTMDEGDIVELNANPCTSTNLNIVTYARFNYEDGDFTVKPQSITRSTGSNLFVNGVALPAYTE